MVTGWYRKRGIKHRGMVRSVSGSDAERGIGGSDQRGMGRSLEIVEESCGSGEEISDIPGCSLAAVETFWSGVSCWCRVGIEVHRK